MTVAAAILLFVTVQRLGELALARRNTARLLARGAVEVAPGHYPLIVVMHAAWLGGLWYLAPGRAVEWTWFAVYAVLQGLRAWVLLSLGARWTTRIIVLPGEAPVRRGPYRYVNHPNYCVVAGEIMVLPLVFGLPWYGVAFTILNAAAMTIRITAENRALVR